MLTYGLAANWLWWSSWIIWMPLVAIIWAPMWRRMRIITTAELITLRYGGRPAVCRPKDLCPGVLLRFFGAADRLHHRVLREDDRADRRRWRNGRSS